MAQTSISLNLQGIIERVRLAEQKSQQKHQNPHILAVSKRQSSDAIREAFACGLKHFGENYVSEALEKQQELIDIPLIWHFIGPIQSNKTRAIAEHFSWVHSVDRMKIAQRLSHQRPAHLPPLNVCLQVNISEEDSKSGVHPRELSDLAFDVAKLPHLTLRGLMAIPAPSDDPEHQRQPFAALCELMAQLKQDLPELDTLSMGMSNDLEAAIYEGATIIRIGTALFGKR